MASLILTALISAGKAPWVDGGYGSLLPEQDLAGVEWNCIVFIQDISLGVGKISMLRAESHPLGGEGVWGYAPQEI